jgi:phosphohistidine phosphatase
MKLYLVRHGEAKSKTEDPDRHLCERGIAVVKKLAKFIKPLDLHVDAIWHSGKPRARETAELLLPAVTSKEGLVERKGLSPNDAVRTIRKELKQGEGDLMIVGHLPFLGCLVSTLIIGKEFPEIVGFETAGAVCLEQELNGEWTIRWVLPPELLG